MFVIPFPLFTSRGTFVIFTVNSTRLQIHYLIRRSTSVSRMVFQHFGSVQPAHHVYLSWQLGGIRDCRVDCILGRPKFSIFISMRSITPTSSQSVGISPIPQSPLQDSPMNVGNALAVPLFTDFQNASECIRSHGPDSCCITGVKGKVADRLSQAHLPFHALEFVRSDLGIWVHEHNAASLLLECLSSTTWIRRLQSVSIVRPVDAGNPWTWKGRTMSNSVLVRFYVAEEGNDDGFDV